MTTRLRTKNMFLINGLFTRAGHAARLSVFALTAASLAACGGSSTEPQSQPTLTATVNANNSLAFAPGQVTLQKGGTVTFSFGSIAHNVFFDNDPAGAPTNIDGNNSSTSVTRTFTTEGVYAYNCHIHPGMRGTVTVVAARP